MKDSVIVPLRVWATTARTLEVETDRGRLPLGARADGWWEAQVPLDAACPDYALVPDGQGPFPDPRSPWQPRGVHGPSRQVDHAAFCWTDRRWQPPPLEDAVIYELHVGTFTPEGTFEAAVGKLAHLLDLGVTHVELMPVAEFPGTRGWGYDGVALFAPHHAYGGPEGLRRLVEACHACGLAVLLDVVYNHLGPSGNYLERFAPYFTDRYVTPWGKAVNLDGPDSDEVRRFLCDNALQWLRDYHVDGLRLDAVHAIVDTSPIHFLEQLADEVQNLGRAVGRRLVLIAESDANDPRLVRSPDAGGYGLDALWSDDFHHSLHALLTGEQGGYYAGFGRLADLAKALRHVFVYDGIFAPHRRRRHGRPAAGLSGHRFVVCLQNHDQVGNRARGERLGDLATIDRLKIGAALLLTSPFVPLLFQGEEWGAATPFLYFTDHDDPGLAHAVREGRRGEFAAFGWKPDDVPDPQAFETYARSKLEWSEPGREPHAGLLDWYRRLIRLRSETPELADGRLDRVGVRFDEAERWLVVDRGPVTIACNLAAEARRIPLTDDGRRDVLLASCDAAARGGAIGLPPESVVVLRRIDA